MEKRAVVIAAVAGLLLVGCTEEGEPEVADTAEPTGEVTVPDEATPTDTGDATATLDTATPTDAATETGTAATDGATAGAAGAECETAVRESGGLADVRNLDAATRRVFDACNSLEEFSSAVESQLEGFEDVELEPYVRTACTFGQDLTGTQLCEAI